MKSNKLQDLKEDIFVRIGERKKQLQRSGVKDIVDFGEANPDRPSPKQVVETLQKTAQNPQHHNYPNPHGSLEFRKQVATWYKERFGVEVDYETEVLALAGSKEGLFHVSVAYIEEGDVGLVTDPAFPIYHDGINFAGGRVYHMPISKESQYLPDLLAIPPEIMDKARVMFLNYPNNPTGALVSEKFIREAITFAKQNNILICYDHAYSELTYDGTRSRSFLEFEGAFEVGLEFITFSKSYNMAGWRLGAAVGNREAIKSLLVVNSHIQSGVFSVIQLAGVTALENVWPSSFMDDQRDEYRRRRDYGIKRFSDIGWDVQNPSGAIYLWVPTPRSMTSEQFAERLLDNYHVLVTPGPAFGPNSEGFIRISLTTPYEDVVKGIDRICEAIQAWR